MATWQELRKKLHEDDPEIAEAYDEMGPAFLLARELIRTRARLGISQAELARRVGTSQSVISRLENMETSPNLKTVVQIAEALGQRVELRFVDPSIDDLFAELPDGTRIMGGMAYSAHLEPMWQAVRELISAMNQSIGAGGITAPAMERDTTAGSWRVALNQPVNDGGLAELLGEDDRELA